MLRNQSVSHNNHYWSRPCHPHSKEDFILETWWTMNTWHSPDSENRQNRYSCLPQAVGRAKNSWSALLVLWRAFQAVLEQEWWTRISEYCCVFLLFCLQKTPRIHSSWWTCDLIPLCRTSREFRKDSAHFVFFGCADRRHTRRDKVTNTAPRAWLPWCSGATRRRRWTEGTERRH